MRPTWQPWFATERPVSLPQDLLFQPRDDFYARLGFLADHIAGAVFGPQEGSAAVFGISAPWGSGKSSALHVLLDLIYDRLHLRGDVRRDNFGFQLNDQYILTASTYRAHLHAGSSRSPRNSLAYQVLQGFPAAFREYLLQNLDYDDNEPGPTRPLKAEIFLRQRLGELASIGPSFEEWMLQSFLEYWRVANDVPESGPSHVHVEFVDDLDRCAESYTAEVLAALNFWTSLPNVFFVVAADEEHLRRSARAATDLDERYPGEALEKFVHFQLRLPALVDGYIDAAEYCLKLMPKGNLPPGIDHLRRLLDSAPTAGPLGVLAPALSTHTPRQAKRVLNELLQEFATLKDLKGDSAKRIVARLVWPTAFEEYIAPAITMLDLKAPADRPSPMSSWLDLLLRAAADVVESHRDDLNRAALRLKEVLQSRGLDIRLCPADLLLYLAADPPLKPPTGLVDLEPSRPDPIDASQSAALVFDSIVGQGKVDALDELATRAKIAFALNQHEELRSVGRELLEVARGRDPSKDDAAAIGNVALRLEDIDPAVAWDLHQTAQIWDPAQPNIRQNLAAFLLQRGGPTALPIVAEHLDWLTQNAPDFKPARLRLLRATLAVAEGMVPPELEVLVADSLEDGASVTFQWQVADVLAGSEQFGLLEKTAAQWIDREVRQNHNDQVGLLLRRLASLLSLANDDKPESRGVDVYRHILRVGFMSDDHQFIYAAQLLSVILSDRGYHRTAGLLLRLAYDIDQQDPQLKASYVSHLVSEGDVGNAQAVQQGQEVRLPPVSDEMQREIFAELPQHFSMSPWWWEVLLPEVPHRLVVGI